MRKFLILMGCSVGCAYALGDGFYVGIDGGWFPELRLQ